MKTVILYAGKYGATLKCAEQLKKAIGADTDLLDLNTGAPKDLSIYDTVIIGGSIYASRIRKPVRGFCRRNEAALLHKRLGLFVCCATPPEKALKYIEENFPASLSRHAAVKKALGGELQIEKMSGLDKTVIKAVSKSNQTLSECGIDTEGILQFAQEIKQ